MRTVEDRKRYYCRIFAQEFSADGKYLVTGDGYGHISLFNLENCLNICEEDEVRLENSRKPIRRFVHSDSHQQEQPSAIYAFASNESHLICGDDSGEISGYRWSDLSNKDLRNVAPQKSWSYPGTSGGTLRCSAEVNALKLSKNGENLLSGGAGDNQLRLWSLEGGREITRFAGHTDYIHDISVRSENEVFTAGEDGQAILWDTRIGNPAWKLIPSTTECDRKGLGAWLGCIATESNWMICGGGPSLGLYHLGSQTLVKVLEAPGTGDLVHHSLSLMTDRILSGGSTNSLFQWDYSGQLTGMVSPMSSTSIYSIGSNADCGERHEVIIVGGAGPAVDVLINPSYRAFSLDSFAYDF